MECLDDLWGKDRRGQEVLPAVHHSAARMSRSPNRFPGAGAG
jgi:hypothetical protein